jgi:hypothetical protein
MHEFHAYIVQRAAKQFHAWRPLANDVYAISFFIYDDNDDPRMPTLTVGHNTVSQWQKQAAGEVDADPPGNRASDSQEAKWNYAFWLQDMDLVIADRRDDPEGVRLREIWINELGLNYDEKLWDTDIDRAIELGQQITAQFVQMVMAVAKHLHDQGIVEQAFGRPVPILVHELEYYEQIAKQTEEANPPGLADEFAQWVRGLGG